MKQLTPVVRFAPVLAGILAVGLWKSDAKASDDITTILRIDQYTIDRCYFGAAAVRPGFRRAFEGCVYNGEVYVTSKLVAIQRMQCKVTYDPVEVYKPKIRVSYAAQVEVKRVDADDKDNKSMYARIVLTDVSNVFEDKDLACNLYKWRVLAD